MINNDAYRMLELFKGQISLETDSQFGYAVTIRHDMGKPIVKGVGSSPSKALENLAVKMEK